VFESHRGHGCSSVLCVCCVLSGRGVCDGLITRPEESYRLWCVVVLDLETSIMRRPWPPRGLLRQKQTSHKLKDLKSTQITLPHYGVLTSHPWLSLRFCERFLLGLR